MHGRTGSAAGDAPAHNAEHSESDGVVAEMLANECDAIRVDVDVCDAGAMWISSFLNNDAYWEPV